MNSDSFWSFYEFLKYYPTIRRPFISLTPDDDIYVSWARGDGQKVSLHFLSNGRVKILYLSVGSSIAANGEVENIKLLEKFITQHSLKWLLENAENTKDINSV